MDKPWFKSKTYGWGWQPATWQGWTALFAYFALLAAGQFVVMSVATDANGKRVSILYCAYILIITVALMALAWKTGEKPEWRWGRRKK